MDGASGCQGQGARLGRRFFVGPGAASHQLTRAAFAPAALQGHAQFELDAVKVQPGPGMAGDLAVRDAAADANNHGRGVRQWIGSINENTSHLQHIRLNIAQGGAAAQGHGHLQLAAKQANDLGHPVRTAVGQAEVRAVADAADRRVDGQHQRFETGGLSAPHPVARLAGSTQYGFK